MQIDHEEQELAYILNVLAERPYKESAGVIANIQRQVNEIKIHELDDGIGGTDVTQLRTASGDKD